MREENERLSAQIEAARAQKEAAILEAVEAERLVGMQGSASESSMPMQHEHMLSHTGSDLHCGCMQSLY